NFDHIENQFENYNNDHKFDEEILHILAGGCGFTSNEFVGELVEKVPKLCKKYDIDRNKVRIINVEAAPTILPGFDKDLVAYAKQSLESSVVELRENE